MEDEVDLAGEEEMAAPEGGALEVAAQQLAALEREMEEVRRAGAFSRRCHGRQPVQQGATTRRQR